MMDINPKIEESWKIRLAGEFEAPYFASLKQQLISEKQRYRIYPPGDRIFAAFNYTPFGNVRVVILGQDPYHGENQANGLCFSVMPGMRKPPSLENIFKELQSDMGIPVPASGDLSKWAARGVLLLNSSLTVRASSPMSHSKIGWEQFTDAVIKKLSDERDGLVFLLWGRFAAGKENLIDTRRHHVLKAAHPSPLSAHAGFFGCRHFSETNRILAAAGKESVDWSL